MAIITLIGNNGAKAGYRFTYRGALTECRDCKLKTVCFNLDIGTEYEVDEVRDVQHECNLHEGGVRVVTLKTVPLHLAIPSKIAEGSVLTYSENRVQSGCKKIGCLHYSICHPEGLKQGNKYKILEVLDDLECALDESLKEVILE